MEAILRMEKRSYKRRFHLGLDRHMQKLSVTGSSNAVQTCSAISLSGVNGRQETYGVVTLIM
jgi:hypothetical protein